MGAGSWFGLSALFRSPWSRRTEDAARKVDEAAEKVGRTNAEIRRATFDHADSIANVRTTVEAVLDKLERQGLKDDPHHSS